MKQMNREIKAKLVNGHYEIYVDGEFKQSCDVDELSETLEDIENDRN